MTGRRPAGVTLVAILAIISGALSILGSVLVFSVGGTTLVVATGIVSLIIGIVTFLVGFFLLRGSSGARILATIFFLLSVFDAIYALATQPAQLWSPLFSGLFALLGLFFLWTKRASIYFARS
jgi:hypothetical protein